MKSTAFAFRLVKSIAVTGIGLMALLVVIGNLTDYYSNYNFVEHVMKMDTIFPDSSIHYRAVNSSALYTFSYILIIVFEACVAFCCLRGAVQLFSNIKSSEPVFHEAKRWAVYGLMLAVLIWFICFQVIGGEWFGMWQSSEWNGLYSADRIATFVAITLVLLQLKEGAIEGEK